MDSYKLRMFIKKTLNESVNIPSNSMNLSEYIDQKLSSFAEEFKKSAIDNKHPYVSIYLQGALYELKRDILQGQRKIGSWEEVYF